MLWSVSLKIGTLTWFVLSSGVFYSCIWSNFSRAAVPKERSILTKFQFCFQWDVGQPFLSVYARNPMDFALLFHWSAFLELVCIRLVPHALLYRQPFVYNNPISYPEPSNFFQRILDENEGLWKGPTLRRSWLVLWNVIQYDKSAICGLLEPVLSRALRFRRACAVRS